MSNKLRKSLIAFLLFFGATSAVFANETVVDCEGMLSTGVVELKNGEFTAEKQVEVIREIIFKAWDEDPRLAPLLFSASVDSSLVFEKDLLLHFSFLSDEGVVQNDLRLADWSKPILQAMAVRSKDGSLDGWQSALKSALSVRLFQDRKDSGEPILNDEELENYFMKVRQVAEKIILISREAGVDVELKEKRFIHPSSHVIRRNGGIGLVFQPSENLDGVATAVAFLVTPWGRYEVYRGQPQISSEQAKTIKLDLIKEFGLRLIQTEFMTPVMKEGELYELGHDAMRGQLPPIYDRLDALPDAELKAALKMAKII